MSLRPGFLYHTLFSGSYKGPSALIENPYLEVKVFPWWFDAATISWKIPDDWGDCVFNIYKSRSSTGEFEKVNISPVDNTTYRDPTPRIFSKLEKEYYVVEAVLVDTGNAILKSKVSTWEVKGNDWVDLRSTEIQRRFWLLLRKFVGPESYVFRRRTFGKRCNTCWDAKSAKVTNDRCPECLGTGWSGGYFQPYKTRLQYEATPNSVDLVYTGRTEPNSLGAATVSFPDINDWDLVYRVSDSKMYRVDKVSCTELLAKPVSQRMGLVELPKNYIEYSLTKDLPL